MNPPLKKYSTDDTDSDYQNRRWQRRDQKKRLKMKVHGSGMKRIAKHLAKKKI